MAWRRQAAAAILCAGALLAGCYRQTVPEYPGFDALAQSTPPAPRVVGGVRLSEDDYQRFVRWGADWFRYTTLGGERNGTDVVGLLNGPIEVPCDAQAKPGAAPSAPGCLRPATALTYFVRALDDLDGVRGNLYSGNGGFEGTGFTHDLVIRFPPGSRVHGLPLPAEVHTGLDVEAGSAWPIGLSPVPVSGPDAALPYVWDLESLGAGPVEGPKKVRLGMTCAMCHYSLDVDWDGKTDLRSAELDRPTPGSPYRPEHSWAVGNQDLYIGWLLALSQNPLVATLIFSGPVGHATPEKVDAWVRWVQKSYRSAPRTVLREVVRGMLLHPRGYADVTSNVRYNATQIPPLYTQHYLPSNSDGAVLNGADRNSIVATSTLDFTGLVALSGDRAGAGAGFLYWEEKTPYRLFTAKALAELMVQWSPAALYDPAKRATLRDDILGVSDGVPGLLNNDALYVMSGPGNAIPPEILNHPENVRMRRIRRPEDYGGDAPLRGPLMALMGIRTRTPPEIARAIGLDALVARYPGLEGDEVFGEAVNVVLDWQPSPPNLSERLARARDLVPRGYAVFREAGCADCHRGPFYTDNIIHRFSARRAEEIGIAAPSTAPWRALGRGSGPAIGGDSSRTLDSRLLSLYVGASYDPGSGRATGAGGPLRGLFGNQVVGYKTTQLRYVWGSAPYLHDGSVGVAILPASRVDRDDLRAVLGLPAAEKVFGMGQILREREARPADPFRADAALSLQALVLRSERAAIMARRDEPLLPVAGLPGGENPLGAPDRVSAADLGITGDGHPFYLDDVPGGERVTALVAFLLAIDDAPGDLPLPRSR